MTKYIAALFLLTSIACRVHAQETIPFEFTSEDDNRLVKDNDSVKYYVATDDSTQRVALNEDAGTYKLFNKAHKIIAEGSYITNGDKYLQDGKWTAHFDNGKLKMTGYYDKGMPIGTWEEFYDNGKPKAVTNYAILKDQSGNESSCMSGSYHEYYKDGRVKQQGFYAAVMTPKRETVEVQDPVSGQSKKVVTESDTWESQKTGKWETYDEQAPEEKAPAKKAEKATDRPDKDADEDKPAAKKKTGKHVKAEDEATDDSKSTDKEKESDKDTEKEKDSDKDKDPKED